MCSVFVYAISTDNLNLKFGITSDLVQTVWLEREQARMGGTGPCLDSRLVWHQDVSDWQTGEQELERIASWPPAWQRRLVENANPERQDLWMDLSGQPIINAPKRSAEEQTSTSKTPYPIIRLVEDTLNAASSAPPVIIVRKRA